MEVVTAPAVPVAAAVAPAAAIDPADTATCPSSAAAPFEISKVRLGAGATAAVFLGRCPLTGMLLAIKRRYVAPRYAAGGASAAAPSGMAADSPGRSAPPPRSSGESHAAPHTGALPCAPLDEVALGAVGRGGGPLGGGRDAAACQLEEGQLLHLAGPHPCIVPLLGRLDVSVAAGDAGPVAPDAPATSFLMMELMDSSIGAELKRGNTALTQPDVVTHVVYRILCAIGHLHKHRIAHRDVKPSNVLLKRLPCTEGGAARPDLPSIVATEPNRLAMPPPDKRDRGAPPPAGAGPVAGSGTLRVCLGDLGSAHVVPSASTADDQVPPLAMRGTLLYKSPEQLMGKRMAHTTQLLSGRVAGDGGSAEGSDLDYFACDLWALGCTMFELATGRPPFSGATDLQVLHHIHAQLGTDYASFPRRVRPAALFDALEHHPRPFVDFLSRLLELDPRNRLTAEQALRHPLFASSCTDDGAVSFLDDGLVVLSRVHLLAGPLQSVPRAQFRPILHVAAPPPSRIDAVTHPDRSVTGDECHADGSVDAVGVEEALDLYTERCYTFSPPRSSGWPTGLVQRSILCRNEMDSLFRSPPPTYNLSLNSDSVSSSIQMSGGGADWLLRRRSGRWSTRKDEHSPAYQAILRPTPGGGTASASPGHGQRLHAPATIATAVAAHGSGPVAMEGAGATRDAVQPLGFASARHAATTVRGGQSPCESDAYPPRAVRLSFGSTKKPMRFDDDDDECQPRPPSRISSDSDCVRLAKPLGFDDVPSVAQTPLGVAEYGGSPIDAPSLPLSITEAMSRLHAAAAGGAGRCPADAGSSRGGDGGALDSGGGSSHRMGRPDGRGTACSRSDPTHGGATRNPNGTGPPSGGFFRGIWSSPKPAAVVPPMAAGTGQGLGTLHQRISLDELPPTVPERARLSQLLALPLPCGSGPTHAVPGTANVEAPDAVGVGGAIEPSCGDCDRVCAATATQVSAAHPRFARCGHSPTSALQPRGPLGRMPLALPIDAAAPTAVGLDATSARAVDLSCSESPIPRPGTVASASMQDFIERQLDAFASGMPVGMSYHTLTPTRKLQLIESPAAVASAVTSASESLRGCSGSTGCAGPPSTGVPPPPRLKSPAAAAAAAGAGAGSSVAAAEAPRSSRSASKRPRESE